MAKRFLLVILCFMLTGGIAFTQNGGSRNTITLDVGPAMVGIFFGKIAAAFDKNAEKAKNDTSGFGIAAQYERQISDRLSVAGRFAYFGADTFVRWADMDLSAFSIEGIGRCYPFNNIFFADLMLGYSRYSVDLSGRDHNKGKKMDLSENYLKLGTKLGIKIDFGKSGGFVLESALGYSYGILLGGDDFTEIDDYSYMGPIGSQRIFAKPVERNAIDAMSKFLFVGGPRMTISLGWSF